MEESFRGKWLTISRAKTEYIECIFSGLGSIEEEPIIIINDLVSHCDKFRYLGATIKLDGGTHLDIANKWGRQHRQTSRVP